MAPALSVGLSARAAPRELGAVGWLRSHEEAVAQSRVTGQPILILFDEVPGCATCVSYGEHVLSDPELVRIIEAHFVPLAIFNNRGGDDRRVLEAYGEPAWNNPVVRIVNAEGQALSPRHAGDYSVSGLARRMVAALEATDREVPAALRALIPG